MTYNLIFLKANNYYNRKIKRFETAAEYINKYESYTEGFTRTIDYNDGINISITVNKEQSYNTLGYNYVLSIDLETEAIDSRWFIIEERLTRKGQWVINLRRDLIADFYDKFTESTIYVEKGRLTKNITDIHNINPLVFNREQFSANQIKTKETLLKDKLGCKWIVGYINKNAYETETSIQATPTLSSAPDTSVATEADLAWLNRYKAGYISYPTELSATFTYKAPNSTYWKMTIGETSNSYATGTETNLITGPQVPYFGLFANKYLNNNNYNDLLSYAIDKYDWATTKAEWFRVLGLNNRILLVKDTNKTYRCRVYRQQSPIIEAGVNMSIDPIWYTNLTAYLKRCGLSYTDSDFLFNVLISRSEGLHLELVEIDASAYNTIIPTTRNRTSGEAFDAFAIPYVDSKPIGLHLENMHQGDITDFKGGLAIAQEICDISSVAIDLQLLPYCPLENTLVSPTSYNDPNIPKNSDYMLTVEAEQIGVLATPIRDKNTVVRNVVFWLTKTDFSTIIEYEDLTDYSNLDAIKLANQVDKWRIESGDYSSSFEFNMARNGSVAYFEADCKYKPYQPYIHIAPNFGGLYGQDFDDTRGLVCSNTNYSLPRLTDAWETFERNNINYMNAFNREIQHMDTLRTQERLSEWFGMAAGTGQGAASGALAGTMMSASAAAGPIGLGIGAGLSAVGGIADNIISEQMYKENKQYAIDRFNMSLENTQALPNTMVAAGALNPNNKVHPVLSLYTCTDIEREAFKQKLKWNGYTIGVITDSPTDYIDFSTDSYFKGQLIDIDLPEAAHEASELATELAKGIIFEKE